MAYSVMAEGRDDDALEQLDAEIGMTAEQDNTALTALRAHQEAAGMTFDDPDAPVAGPEPDDGLEPWMRGDA